jgi:hypothetical protein
MQDSQASETLTRLGAWLAGLLLGGGGLLGWAKHRLDRERQFVELGLIAAQTEEVKANVHKITVDGLVQSALTLKADNERLRAERDDALRHAGAAEVAREEAKRQVELYELQMNKIRALLKEHGLEFPN